MDWHHPHHYPRPCSLFNPRIPLLSSTARTTQAALPPNCCSETWLPFTASPHRAPKTVKLDSRETPPPLQYSPTTSDRERTSTAESSPVGTPTGFGAFSHHRRAEKDNFSWHRKATDGFGARASLYLDSALLEPELGDSTFPLFAPSPPSRDMAGRTSPINIATSSRHSSASPRVQQTSNLTTALHSTTGNESRLTSAVNIAGSNSKGFTAGFGRSDSMGGTNLGVGTASQYGTGAQPMSMNIPNHANPRRGSVAGSLVGGLSWGGVSVGSFIRDE